MIELKLCPSHQALASDGSNAYQSTHKGASRMLGNTISSSRRGLRRDVWCSRFQGCHRSDVTVIVSHAVVNTALKALRPNLVVNSTDSAQCNIAWEHPRTDVTSSQCFYRTVYCSPKDIRAER
jgi:hypothetical protein